MPLTVQVRAEALRSPMVVQMVVPPETGATLEAQDLSVTPAGHAPATARRRGRRETTSTPVANPSSNWK
jgi:hypothetical protein